jgi:single-strand DNA-binding protein
MYVKKGSKLFIEGQLETRKWTDASGQEKYSTEVVLRAYKGELTFLDSRSNNNDNDSFQSSNQVNETKNTEINQVVNEPSGIDSDIDDDIPF